MEIMADNCFGLHLECLEKETLTDYCVWEENNNIVDGIVSCGQKWLQNYAETASFL